jgi:hypothetical protein
VLFVLEPSGEQVQRLERPAERRFRRWWRHLEPRRPHVVAAGVVHAEVVQLASEYSGRPSASAGATPPPPPCCGHKERKLLLATNYTVEQRDDR